MGNKRIVRIQLAVLAVLTILVVGRVVVGPGEPEGVIVISDLDPGELQVVSFHLDRAEPFLLEATGSLEKAFDASEPMPALAAYPWIVNRDTRDVTWRMDPDNVQVESATAIHSASTVTLGPGQYDVFFTTYGNSESARRSGKLFGRLLGTHWTKDADQWHITLRSAGDNGSSATLVSVADAHALAPGGDDLLWTSAPMKNYTKEQYVFSVDAPARVRAYSIGELCAREECDIGWVEDVFSGRKIWELKEANSDYAGGMKANRASDVTLDLAPGVYRAVFKTDARHAWGSWIANPPFDPAGWGLSLYQAGGRTGVISTFDPWTRLEPVLSIDRVGNSERRQAQFEVLEPVEVVLQATGEITGSGSLYDYAWLRNDASQEKVWEMSWSESYPAGGADKNRQQTAFVRLDPGTYSVFYETDDSHAYDSWNSPRPTNPERWGVTLFAFDHRNALRVEHSTRKSPPAIAKPSVPPPPLPAMGTGKTLVEATALGNDAAAERTFTLAAPSKLRIYAVGEISMSGRYDYGWIENADGTTVWEMTYENTVPAGGDDANRAFDGVIELPAGSYVVRFVTDFSHAYGDFGNEGPAKPSSWGIRVELLPR